MPEMIESILTKYSRKRDELIPILQGVQKEYGFISTESVSRISRYLRISENQIFGVSSFYAQFRFTVPGRHAIREGAPPCLICLNGVWESAAARRPPICVLIWSALPVLDVALSLPWFRSIVTYTAE
jgi:hypothetical protein